MVVVRRLLFVMALCAAGAASFVLWQRRGATGASTPHGSHSPHAPWPVFDPAPPAPGGAAPSTSTEPAEPVTTEPAATEPVTTERAADELAAAERATWVAPAGGSCPDGYPVKAKQSSRIYHVPGGRFYDKTVPDRCYADPASAEADGYRASKS